MQDTRLLHSLFVIVSPKERDFDMMFLTSLHILSSVTPSLSKTENILSQKYMSSSLLIANEPPFLIITFIR